ncbi:MAG: D-TA family PLP-dependent enzyme, partial [Saprospiraceae bacterium]|nr:D-TA family PLP-dependent enzyme [Saprospiraceae bacterium]
MRESTTDWFRLEEENVIDTPALLIYSERVRQNVDHLVGMIDDKLRLRPHMKTNKSEEAARLLIDAGVEKFKCATIAEAETLAMAHAKDILLAYQPTRPKQKRFVELMKAYPNIKFSCLIDNLETARQIAQLGTKSGIVLDTYIDVNLGMDRTGIEPGTPTINLIREANNLDGLTVQGLHVYDGHLRDANIQTRTEKCNNDFQRITQTLKILQQEGYQMKIVAGGSPTFPIHAKRPNVECSPGTFIYWDWG